MPIGLKTALILTFIFTAISSLKEYIKTVNGRYSIYLSVPDHNEGRPIEVNACILITHMVYL